MIPYLICFCLMRPLRPLLFGLLLLVGATTAFAQTEAAAPAAAALPEAATRPLLLKVGLNAGRALRYSGYSGLSAQLPVSAGAEYALSPKFTLYGQADVDLGVASRQDVYGGNRGSIIPSGAIGIGARYYYNQARRARHNRAHGPFVGNYLALEAHTEARRRSNQSLDVSPGLNAVWGMQRRLGRSFLFDFNTGLGVSPVRSDTQLGFSSGASGSTNFTAQFNLGIYFGR